MSTDQTGGVTRYRARGAIVQAVRWTGRNHDDMAALAGDAWPGYVAPNPPADDLIVDTPQGEARAHPGDWVIRGVTGKFFIRSDEEFRMAYEPADSIPVPPGRVPEDIARSLRTILRMVDNAYDGDYRTDSERRACDRLRAAAEAGQ